MYQSLFHTQTPTELKSQFSTSKHQIVYKIYFCQIDIPSGAFCPALARTDNSLSLLHSCHPKISLFHHLRDSLPPFPGILIFFLA